MVKIRPVNDSILIEIGEDEWVDPNSNVVRILKSGLIEIPSQFKGWYLKRASEGKVLRVGSGVRNIIKVGDQIRFRPPSLKINDEEPNLRIILEHQVLAWLE